MVDLSLFDPWLLTDGLTTYFRPRGDTLLERLGRTDEERVEAVAELIRQSSDEEIAQLMRIVQQAMAEVAQERAAGAEAPASERRRRPNSVERRAERRRAEAGA